MLPAYLQTNGWSGGVGAFVHVHVCTCTCLCMWVGGQVRGCLSMCACMCVYKCVGVLAFVPANGWSGLKV